MPYYNSYMPQQNNYNNQFMQQPMQQPMQMQQTMQPQMQQMPMQMQRQEKILQGKYIDNIDVMKATEIPLDGSISYFPLTDGTAIITRQLMPDGTSKTVIYLSLIHI